MKRQMKRQMKNLCLLILLVVATSCTDSLYYQVYKANAVNTDSRNLVFENDDCIITYDLWAEGGNSGFFIHNKTDKMLYLNLEGCYFVLNGIAHDYFQNRTYSSSISVGKSVATLSSPSYLYLPNKKIRIGSPTSLGAMSSSKNTMSVEEQKLVRVPAHSSKYIKEFEITEGYFSICEQQEYPSSRKVLTSTFSQQDSPIHFENRISYLVEGSRLPVNLKHSFYVSEITNQPHSDFYGFRSKEKCGVKQLEKVKYYELKAKDKFYIEYRKSL